jgi:glucoamylase
VSDGWQQLRSRRALVDLYDEARNGNVALTGELDFAATGGTVVLALGFGRDGGEAGHNARAALLSDFSRHVNDYVAPWQAFQRRCLDLGEADESGFDAYRVSTAVLKTHQGKRFDGAFIASLSIPWGASKSDDDLGGYHLTWPRDLVEAAGGLLAAGDADGARQALVYLMATQEPDGHWPQNMWADGTPYWNCIQLDEAAFPILLADALRRADALDGLATWTMARRAAGYIVRYGPATQQDRWEEKAGYSPFTLAVEIAALLAAADMAAAAGEDSVAAYLRETADAWNDAIERWTYVSGTELARACGVAGYYVRIAPAGAVDVAGIPVTRDDAQDAAARIVSVDALALVRFGLRAADDPRIRDTVVVIDHVLRTETRTGPAWHRYNGDRYGEHADGSPYDGDGIGRGWPLLAGERAHYEFAAGRAELAAALGRTMLAQSSPGRLIPEQVWESDDLPARELQNGHPAGSAMPLVWAHAEYVKLRRSLRDGKVFDLPPQPVRRYQVDRVASRLATWRQNLRCAKIVAGMTLRIELSAAAVVHWSADAWNTVVDTPTVDTSLGVHFADLPTAALHAGTTLRFTFRWCDEDRWQGEDYACVIVAGTVERASSSGAPSADGGVHVDPGDAAHHVQHDPAKLRPDTSRRRVHN